MKKTFIILLVSLTLLLSSLACSFSQSLTFLDTITQNSEELAEEVLAAPTVVIVQDQSIAEEPSTQLVVQDNPLLLESTLIELYDRVSPGVVSIQTLDASGGSQGSGFVYDEEGHIITNYHVVEGAQDIEVDFPSGIKVHGEVIGVDLDSDLAVIVVDVSPEDLYPVVLGDSDELKVGQSVVAIGNPYGLTGTMTTGIVSAKGRTLTSLRETPEGRFFSAGDLIQTDASINPGNSGGPLLNINGEVVGINRAIRTSGVTETGDPVNTGIGFAVSVNILKRVVPDLILNGSYDYPYVGVSAREELSLLEMEAVGLERSTGAYVVEVVPGGPADTAGLRAGAMETEYLGLYSGGDLIIAVDGKPVQVFGDFLSYLMTQKSPGDSIVIRILRDNEEMEVEIILDRRP